MNIPKPTEGELLTVDDAIGNALLYGIGIIKIVNTAGGPVMSVVDPRDYYQVAEHMKFAADNMLEPPK
ncbi:hypothetical protein [Caudoviricetes sp.]|nr:hypothetical protein [Caudoviricetes sp.]